MTRSRARLAAPLAAALLLLLLAAPVASYARAASHARAQQGHSIRGKVRDASGNGVPRVIVELQAGTGATVGQTNTNNEGDFFFAGLVESSYTVVVRSPDHNPVSETVEFTRRVDENTPGELRTVEMTITPRAGLTPRPAPGRVAVAQAVPARAREAFDRGMKLAREGKAQEAELAVREAVGLFPDYFDARFWLANELIRTNRLDDAVQQLEVARRVSPKDGRIYLSFGQLLMLKRNFAVAAAVFAEAARLSPADPQGFMQRGTALVEYASRIDPSASTKAAAERRAALDDAEKSLTQAYRLSGKRLSAVHLQLARVYEKRGEPARAADELEQYLGENPSAANAPAIRGAVKTLRAAKP
jgi:tetratricopeptide (TPR) repeat protein